MFFGAGSSVRTGTKLWYRAISNTLKMESGEVTETSEKLHIFTLPSAPQNFTSSLCRLPHETSHLNATACPTKLHIFILPSAPQNFTSSRCRLPSKTSRLHSAVCPTKLHIFTLPSAPQHFTSSLCRLPHNTSHIRAAVCPTTLTSSRCRLLHKTSHLHATVYPTTLHISTLPSAPQHFTSSRGCLPHNNSPNFVAINSSMPTSHLGL
jgi:hypothetical protein